MTTETDGWGPSIDNSDINDVLIGYKPISCFAFQRDWLKEEFGTSPENLKLVNLTGDSMKPVFQTGDLILLDTSVSQVEEENIYFLLYNDRPIIKKCSGLEGHILLRSYNPEYQDIVVKQNGKDRLKIIGKAVWMCRRLKGL